MIIRSHGWENSDGSQMKLLSLKTDRRTSQDNKLCFWSVSIVISQQRVHGNHMDSNSNYKLPSGIIIRQLDLGGIPADNTDEHKHIHTLNQPQLWAIWSSHWNNCGYYVVSSFVEVRSRQHQRLFKSGEEKNNLHLISIRGCLYRTTGWTF